MEKKSTPVLLMVKTIFISALVVAALSGCAGYVPGRQSYWDAQVREMCAKDGGVAIFEQIVLSSEQAANLQKVGSYFSIPPRSAAKPDAPVFWDERVTTFHDANPRVWRSEQIIRRRGDEKIIARVVRYVRVGGDVPSLAHHSNFSCPDELDVLAKRETIFSIQGK